MARNMQHFDTMLPRMTAAVPASRTLSWGYFDNAKAMDWSMTGAAIKVSVAAALLFITIGFVPLLTSVHGQVGETELDREVARLNKRIDQLDGVPSQISLILEHQRLRDAEEDEREIRHQTFESHEMYGQIGAFGAIFMVIFGAFIHWWTGFTPVRPLDRKRERT
jgi:hypothetical protein